MMYDIIIIGGGPAGLTAAVYARRANKNVLVLEAMVCGGQIVNAGKIENYPAAPGITGPEFAQTLKKQAEGLGAHIEYEKAEEITKEDGTIIVKTEDDKFRAQAAIIACGTEPRRLGLNHEDRFIGRGVSYCATCDGAFFKDKVVAVNGGGNSALHEAIYLSSLAKKVYLIHRRNEFRADASLVDEARERSNIEFVLNATVVALKGDDKLNKIDVSRDGNTEEIQVDGLFVSIGRTPNVGRLVDGVSLTDDGFIQASEDCTTDIPGIFVAGDVRHKDVRQLVTAASDGAIAAEAALNYLDMQ